MSVKLYSFNTQTRDVMQKIKLLAFRVASAFFRIAEEMRQLPSYFYNPGEGTPKKK